MNLKEIEERHELEGVNGTMFIYARAEQAHLDRAFLLAEVKRLKALAGKVVTAKISPCGECCELGWLIDPDLLAELKEAASE